MHPPDCALVDLGFTLSPNRSGYYNVTLSLRTSPADTPVQPHSHCSEALPHPGPELWLSDWDGELLYSFRIIILGMGQSNLLTKVVGG